MTDRINAFTVVLEENIREDDAEGLRQAIRQLRGVLRVEPHVANPIDEMVAETRLKSQLLDGFVALLYPDRKGS